MRNLEQQHRPGMLCADSIGVRLAPRHALCSRKSLCPAPASVRLPNRLLAHLRRWKRLKLCRQFVVEWSGASVKDVDRAHGAGPSLRLALRGGGAKRGAMTALPISILTICGLSELEHHSARGVTHVLSILDPGWAEPEAFFAYDPHHRATLHFHDVIEPGPGLILPAPEHVEAILAFGRDLAGEAGAAAGGHVLVHCHMGISRSTAAMAILLAQLNPREDEDRIFARLVEVRPQAWPNSRMVGFADALLAREGRLSAALGRLYARQLGIRPETARYMQENGRAREVAMAAAA